ncbi:DNA methyltransferase [Xanthobacter sp. V7C-4]|uniref:site-specific DNA-methyltransferase n=1 Tax=Xanthobacter autotrophicus (strain ATCC BAA-1158 / Py2) TaxID=78245 RepID=UPI0037290C7A
MTRQQAKRTTPTGDLVKTYGERVEMIPVGRLKPYPRNARIHSRKQIGQIANSLKRFGFTNPVLIDDDNTILAGHGRVEAAKLIGMATVPCLRLSSMSAAEKRAYVLADNKLASNAGWDDDILAGELKLILDDVSEIDIGITGFTVAEIDTLLDTAESGPTPLDDGDDTLPEPAPYIVSRVGDIWQLGNHRLACGDARDEEVYRALMSAGPDGGAERAQLVFTDPPYNVRIRGNVSNSSGHREFVMASGEMSQDAFVAFLTSTFQRMATWSEDGSIHFVCMDWRHMDEISAAGRAIFSELKNLIVWAKDNAGMGTFYRSRHELIFVFKNGAAPHINAFELGQNGRSRTNVWNYRGITSPTKESREALQLHPTVKPVAMVADALKDCSRRGGIVLDPFCGSGTIFIAAQKTGRRARAIELDPSYCDTAIRRWQLFAKDDAVLVETGETFDEVAARRGAEPAAPSAGEMADRDAAEGEVP